MTYNTIGRGSRKPVTNNIYKRLYRQTSPKSLIISGLGNCDIGIGIWSALGYDAEYMKHITDTDNYDRKKDKCILVKLQKIRCN